MFIGIFRSREVAGANLIQALTTAAMFAMFLRGRPITDSVPSQGRLAEAPDDVWGREDDVVRIVHQDAIEVVSVPRCRPLLREPEREVCVHGDELYAARGRPLRSVE
jgi:hypothetical protein